MVNPKHVAVALMIMLVLLGTTVLGIAVIVSPAPPGTDDTQQDDDTFPSPVTAMAALITAKNDANVTAWKSGKTNVVLSSVSTDFCSDGLSTAWVVTYQSDGEDATIQVSGDKVKGIITSVRSPGMSLAPPVETSDVLDSEAIYEKMAAALEAAGRKLVAPSAFTLKAMSAGTYVWDIKSPVEGGYYLMTMDASSGDIIDELYLKV